MSIPKWLQILATLGPQILAFTPLAPIAAPVSVAIAAAEGMAGKTGAEKLQSVVEIANQAAVAVNSQAGHQVVDPAQISSAATQAINTVVTVVNATHEAAK